MKKIIHSRWISVNSTDLNGSRSKESLPLRALGSDRAFELIASLPLFGLGIVGTRKCLGITKELLKKILLPFRGSKLIILSGFARGVDRLAHETALELELPTVAVFGCGVDVVYPPEHSALKEKILDADGLILSPFSDSLPPLPHHFLKRNYWIAALSHAVWVVEAPFKSGAINTAHHAIACERKLLVTPGHPLDSHFHGCNQLLAQGNAQILFDSLSLQMNFPHLPLHTDSQSVSEQKKNTALFGLDSSKFSALEQFLYSQSLHSRGATETQLQDWWMEQGWTLSSFFETLQEALRNEWIKEDNGVFLKNLR